jgi:hypothetical protein
MRTDAGHADVNDVTPDPGTVSDRTVPGAFQVDSGDSGDLPLDQVASLRRGFQLTSSIQHFLL